ncbi:MAG: TldD/PmbA family protein [Actinomycetota bacterium]|nr:TldD/PmbA family protein [Actinomycetota bacterium]
MDLSDLAEACLEAVRALPDVQYADARAVREDAESVNVRDDRVEGVGRGSSQGVGVRVLVDGAWGFAATSANGADDPGEVPATVQRAHEIARASAAVQPGPRVKLDDTPPAQGEYATPHERDPLDVPLTEKIDYLLATAAAGREAAGLSWIEVSTDAWRRRTAFRSTEGGRIDQTVIAVGGGLEAYALGGGEVQRRCYPNSFRGQFVTGGWESVLALDLPGHARGHATEAVALLDAPDLPYREDTVLLLGSSQLALQVHESIGHATELDRIMGMERAYAGTSFVDVADRGSLRYGSALVSVTADATTPGALGTFGFDDEGVAAHSSPIIADGVLVGFLSNRETAARLRERSNGTARADSWGTIPLIRMNNVSLHPGPDPDAGLEELVADTADGVLLETNRSWSIDDRRDNFQFGCEVAYEIRGGRRGRLYRNGTYAGRCLDFWRSCDALGGQSDWTVWGVPNCGKGQPGQVARVAHGAPTGRFRATVGVH